MVRSLIAASCLVGLALPAFAQVQTTGFSITAFETDYGVNGFPVLLSESAGVAEFSFGGMYAGFSQSYDSMGYTSLLTSFFDRYNQSFTFQVREGYSITGISFTGIFDAYLQHGSLPSYYPVISAGSATNAFNAQVTVGDQSDTTNLSNVNATTAFAASTSALNLTGTFEAELAFDVATSVTPALYQQCQYFPWGPGNCYTSYAYTDAVGYRMGDMRMTVSYASVAAPVPEPETYGLMLAGLGVVGAVARRRRQAKA